MNRIFEFERKRSELLSDIQDVMHAASINMRGVCAQVAQRPMAALQQQLLYTQGLLLTLADLINSRQSLFMTFLITKQIKQEEAKIRSQRLNQYEQKIYDQKRIIAQKEIFFQNLLRPRKKRQPHQTTEKFQQSRAKQRQNEQITKSDQLARDTMDFQVFRLLMDGQEKLKPKGQLPAAKISSQFNLTLFNQDKAQLVTDRVPTALKGNKDDHSTHNRTHSAQNQFNKHVFSPRKDVLASDFAAKAPLVEIQKMGEKNEELHCIYDQQMQSYAFKKNQKAKLQKQYELISQQLQNTKRNFNNIKRQQSWRHQKVHKPTDKCGKRPGSK